MLIRDPIHGLVRLTEREAEVVGSRAFQRLYHVKQTSMAYLVYPGLMHSRFEHSVGVMHVAGRMAEAVGWDVERARLIGLLHDVGHPAFSHDGELALALEGLSGGHEEEGERIAREAFPDVWKELKGAREEALISFSLGADRMDYLQRDSHHGGVAYGVIEEDYIVNNLVAEGGRLYVREKALPSVESFLLARFFMFSNVYLHKTVRIVSGMLVKALILGLRRGLLGKEDFYERDEGSILFHLSKTLDVAKRLRRRELYKLWRWAEGDGKLYRELLELSLKEPFVVHMRGSIVKDYDVDILGPSPQPLRALSPLLGVLDKVEDRIGRLLIAIEPGREKEVEEMLKPYLR